MLKTLFFSSSIFDYWLFVHSAWMKLGMRRGNGAFNYTRKKFRSYSYVEDGEDENRNPEGIIFWDDDLKFPIVAVFAEALSPQKVKLTVHFEKEAAKKIGRSAIARWTNMLALMEEDGRLEYPPKSKKPKPKYASQYSQKRYGSIRRMLEKIAYRDDWLAEHKNSPAWSLKSEGAIDKHTANEINKEVGGLIKEQWQYTNVPGDVFANLLFEKYKHFPNLRSEWKKLRNKGS